MTHVGQKCALGHVGDFGLVPRFDQFADVNNVQQDPVILAIAVDWLHLEDDLRAAKGALEHEGSGADLGAKVVYALDDSSPHLGLMNVFDLFAENVFATLSHHVAKGLIDLDDHVVGVGEDNAALHAGNHGGEFGVFALRGFFRPIANGDFVGELLVGSAELVG